MTTLIDYIIAREEVKASNVAPAQKEEMLEKLRKEYEEDKRKREEIEDLFIVKTLENMRVKMSRHENHRPTSR